MKLCLMSSGDGFRNVACNGEMTVLDLPRDEEPLEQLLGPDCFTHKVLLDLENATYMDTGAVGWLIGLHKKFKQSGGRLILHSIPPLVDQMFQLLKLPAVLHVTADQAAARAAAQLAER